MTGAVIAIQVFWYFELGIDRPTGRISPRHAIAPNRLLISFDLQGRTFLHYVNDKLKLT